jgi:hypothetical protein
MIIESSPTECNATFIEHINYIVKQEQLEKYPHKSVQLIVLTSDYDDFKDYEISDNTFVSFFLMGNSFLYRYIGGDYTIKKDNLERIYYVIF